MQYLHYDPSSINRLATNVGHTHSKKTLSLSKFAQKFTIEDQQLDNIRQDDKIYNNIACPSVYKLHTLCLNIYVLW